MNLLFNKLEYFQMIQILETYCKTYLGKKLCNCLTPSFTIEEVQTLLTQTSEATTLLHQKGVPPFSELEEMELLLKRLESNATLSIKALFTIAHLLKMSCSLKSYFYEDESFDLSNFASIEPYFANLYTNSSLEKSISDKLLDENTIADHASSKLFSLRKARKNLESAVKDKLNSYLYSSSYSKYIMEPIVTIRNHRYVIPVKEEYKEKVKGFVHDTSSSGSTLYIEPMAVFELNNQINHNKMEEELEIQSILQILSNSLVPFITELWQTLSSIAHLDLLFAKALYGKEENAILPNLNTKKEISLLQARHPLLEKSVAVPITISLGKNFSCLLITGPNTGGKTVALKTMGLLLLMAYSGIPISCHETSSICVFSRIFVDIGDEQSLEQNLSTFSAHLKNVITITNEANDHTLVLLDELGSGTDPIEGSALAISILSYLKELGTLVCCTTHYSELKEFALVTEGFENASFEFDLENLKPTYHLLLGVPGKSNAFEISKKLGLSSSILENAISFVKEDKIGIEELLKNIYEDKITIEKEKEELEKNLKQITSLRQSLEEEQTTLSMQKKALLEKAKNDARLIILDAKEEVNHILQELSQKHVDLKSANQSRNQLNEKMKSLCPTPAEAFHNSNEALEVKDVKKGCPVWIPSLQVTGSILSTHVGKSKEVLVQVGLAKMNLKLDKLCKAPTENSSSKKPLLNTSTHTTGSISTSISSKAQFASTQINVIGQNVEEAVSFIDKYIDNCVMSHLSPIRIVHGKGTGKLRMRNS